VYTISSCHAVVSRHVNDATIDSDCKTVSEKNQINTGVFTSPGVCVI